MVQIKRELSEVDYVVQVQALDSLSEDLNEQHTEIYIGLLLDRTWVTYHDQYIADSKLLVQGFQLVVQKQQLSAALVKNEKALKETSQALSQWQKHHSSDQTAPLTLEKELMFLHKKNKQLMQKISKLYAP